MNVTRIFLMNGNTLYHAATWGHYHAVYATAHSQTPNPKSSEDAERLTGQVLVSPCCPRWACLLP